ncbi:hypothetical protein [Natronococcus occultus]|uniref:DUF8163 domain-containing protein n=1 Tax=Natronococcus occultus SP4 TaxID=694430 RepID=L0K0W4_9EURY|nr:hypothetical protein [Natronococcus occultus]AGB38641.1 hypothetical protein Natoc_2883 [Natronococcus occultus SP4]
MSDPATATHVESTFVTERPSTLSTAVGAVALVGAFGAAAGPPGIGAGIATILLWYGFGTPYAIAVGHVLLLALFPDGIDPIAFVLAEAGLLAVLVLPALQTRAPLRTAAGTLLTVAVLGGVSWLAVVSLSLWQAAAVTAGTIALAGYALYRYGLVALGLVDDDASSTTDE